MPSLRPVLRELSFASGTAGARVCDRQTATGTVATTAALARSDPARPTRREPPAAPRRPRRTSEMAGIAEGRLREERRSWRKDHPIGFVARPRSKADGSTDLLNWDVVIPGKKDTMYAFPRPRCLLILASGRVSTSCRHDGVPARRTRDVLPHRHAIAATHPDDDATRVQVGGLRVQPHDGVLQRLPGHRAGRQVREPSGRGRELCGNQRHRADAATEKISRRWRGAPEI